MKVFNKFFLLAFLFISCDKAGPAGPAGTNGLNGTNGTSYVSQTYTITPSMWIHENNLYVYTAYDGQITNASNDFLSVYYSMDTINWISYGASFKTDSVKFSFSQDETVYFKVLTEN